MTTFYSTAVPKFFPHLSCFVHRFAHGILNSAQLSRLESGRLLHGESRRVSNLSALADQWRAVREVLRASAHSGNATPDEVRLGDEAWALLRCMREDLRTPQQHERMNAMRAFVSVVG